MFGASTRYLQRTRKETTVTTIMVFVVVFIWSIFFLLADQVMRLGVSFPLGINS